MNQGGDSTGQYYRHQDEPQTQQYVPQTQQYAPQNQQYAPQNFQQAQWIEPKGQSAILALIISLFIPGMGHVLIGQTKKGIYYLIESIILAIVLEFIVLATFGCGLIFLPFMVVRYIINAIDAFKMGQRLEQGIAIMQGECSNSVAALGVNIIVVPTFVTGSPDAPDEWKRRVGGV